MSSVSDIKLIRTDTTLDCAPFYPTLPSSQQQHPLISITYPSSFSPNIYLISPLPFLFHSILLFPLIIHRAMHIPHSTHHHAHTTTPDLLSGGFVFFFVRLHCCYHGAQTCFLERNRGGLTFRGFDFVAVAVAVANLLSTSCFTHTPLLPRYIQSKTDSTPTLGRCWRFTQQPPRPEPQLRRYVLFQYVRVFLGVFCLITVKNGSTKGLAKKLVLVSRIKPSGLFKGKPTT